MPRMISIAKKWPFSELVITTAPCPVFKNTTIRQRNPAVEPPALNQAASPAPLIGPTNAELPICGVKRLFVRSADSSWLVFPALACCKAIISWARSVGVVHSPSAAASGYTYHPFSTGKPSTRCPLAADSARSAGSGCANVLRVMPILSNTRRRANSANGCPSRSSSNCCAIK